MSRNKAYSKAINPAAYERWQAPNFASDHQKYSIDSTSDQPATAAEIESIQKQAYDEGFAKGHQDGIEKGLNDSRSVIETRLTCLNNTLNLLAEPLHQLDEDVVQQTAELAMIVAQHLVQREMKLDPAQIVGVVREALKVLPVSAREVKIYLHPDDATLVKESFSVTSSDNNKLSWMIIEDPLLKVGGCKVTSENSSIDATVEKRIKRIITSVLGGDRFDDE